ncbi:Os05g0501350, partial [Oryza sativa Japonica Group]
TQPLLLIFCSGEWAGAAVATGKQKAATAAAGRPGSRNRQALGDIGNVLNAHVVDGKIQLPEGINRPITRSFGAQLLKKAQENAVGANKVRVRHPFRSSCSSCEFRVFDLIPNFDFAIKLSCRSRSGRNQLRSRPRRSYPVWRMPPRPAPAPASTRTRSLRSRRAPAAAAAAAVQPTSTPGRRS